ncbi:MAG TPA: class I SAM-dependent methyltransferase [Thiothrix sp.]|nr:class I SAM-dependent methyltransferase [Thiothrix sp.]
MKEFDPVKYRKMVRSFQERDDPTGWFDSIYRDAEGNHSHVFWADLVANPYLLEWLENHPSEKINKTAIVVGCGVGDDAEALAEAGYKVIGFDISPSAIELCKNRYPDSTVHYLVADLFDYDPSWFQAFDLVFECNTIQVLPGKYRVLAREAIASLVAKGGHLLASCRSRFSGEQEDMIPLPLDRQEIDRFKDSGLTEKSFLAYDDDQNPPVPHFFATYKREG